MSTAYVSAKVVIDLVKESSDVFPSLKSTASGLSAILKHCDVCIACALSSIRDVDYHPSKRWQTNEQ